MMEHAVSFLEEKIENIGHENNCLIIDENKDSLSRNKVFLEKNQDEKSEAIHLQQSKRSIFYQKAKKIFDSVKKAVDVNQQCSKSLIKNPLYSTSLASYFLDNWTGLTPLWTAFLLVDPKFHENSEVFTKQASKLNFKNIPRTQGLVELHQKVTKEITLNGISKRRVDTVFQSLYNDNIVSTGKGQFIKGKESYNNPNPNPFLLKKSAINQSHQIKVKKSL